MKRTGFSTLSAMALALGLLGGPVLAQGFSDTTASGLAKLGVSAPVEAMSTEQQAQIQNVLASTDTDDSKRKQIQQILGNEATETSQLSVTQLRSSVGADLAKAGIPADGIDQLSLSQLAQIENIMAGPDSDSTKKMRVEQVMGNEATNTTQTGVTQLQDSVSSDISKIGVDTEGVSQLSVSELAQIQNIMNSTMSDANKKMQVEKILSQ